LNDKIIFDNVSKFYGEVLGVNRVHLSIPSGITSLVGPNGSGKSTLMNLMTGLLQPSQGSVSVVGHSPRDPEKLFTKVGYCSQYDSFPKGLSGRQFVYSYLRVHGFDHARASDLTEHAMERVGLLAAANRNVAGYSKGMRQRIKLAQAIAHEPSVLVLDEPLNGLDPMARAEMIDLFKEQADSGCHVIISSHILHEVDLISDQVILLNEGYIVAEGDIRGVRSEMEKHPLQIMIRCDRPALLAARVFEQDGVVEVKIHDDRQGMLVRTKDAGRFYLALNRIILDNDLRVEAVTPADEDVEAVYQYLIGDEKEKS
jgi:ABC-2 type transport system ATP-binding protein